MGVFKCLWKSRKNAHDDATVKSYLDLKLTCNFQVIMEEIQFFFKAAVQQWPPWTVSSRAGSRFHSIFHSQPFS